MTFTFPDGDWPDTKRDHISLGFRTLQSDAVLLRIISASSNDFIEMELASDDDDDRHRLKTVRMKCHFVLCARRLLTLVAAGICRLSEECFN